MVLVEQYKSNGVLHIDIVAYLKKMGHNVDKLLDDAYLYKQDLYSQLMYVKLALEIGRDVEVVQKLSRQLLGR